MYAIEEIAVVALEIIARHMRLVQITYTAHKTSKNIHTYMYEKEKNQTPTDKEKNRGRKRKIKLSVGRR